MVIRRSYVNHVYDEKKRCHGDQCFDKVLTNSCNIICALSFLRAFIDAILQGDPSLLPFNYSEGLNHLPEVLDLPESKLTVHEQKTDDVNFPDILGRIASQLEGNNKFLEISRFYDSDIRSLARLFCQDNAKGKILISFLNEEELRSLVERCYSQYLKVVLFLDAYSYRITSSYTPDSLYLCIIAMMDFFSHTKSWHSLFGRAILRRVIFSLQNTNLGSNPPPYLFVPLFGEYTIRFGSKFEYDCNI